MKEAPKEIFVKPIDFDGEGYLLYTGCGSYQTVPPKTEHTKYIRESTHKEIVNGLKSEIASLTFEIAGKNMEIERLKKEIERIKIHYKCVMFIPMYIKFGMRNDVCANCGKPRQEHNIF